MILNRFTGSSVILVFGALLWISGCSSSGNSVEIVPQQVLLSSTEELVIEGREITLSANLSRNFASSSTSDGEPLLVKIKIVASNGENLPDGLNTDAVWIIVDDKVWGSSYYGEQFKDDKTRLVKIARKGPKFGVGKKAVVIVRIHHNGSTYLLKSTDQRIERTS